MEGGEEAWLPARSKETHRACQLGPWPPALDFQYPTWNRRLPIEHRPIANRLPLSSPGLSMPADQPKPHPSAHNDYPCPILSSLTILTGPQLFVSTTLPIARPSVSTSQIQTHLTAPTAQVHACRHATYPITSTSLLRTCHDQPHHVDLTHPATAETSQSDYPYLHRSRLNDCPMPSFPILTKPHRLPMARPN